jgi:hypothetical protein
VLHEFLLSRRAALIERCRLKVVARRAACGAGANADLEHGIPLFLEQLIETLRVEQTSNPMLSRKLSGAGDGGGSRSSVIGGTAAQHGLELLRHGFTVDQVVHDYGDLCQAITEMAFEDGVQIQADEFRTLNRCLDNAIADAVTEYSLGREISIAEKGTQSLNERLGFLAHELRNLIHIATLSFTAIKTGSVGPTGATGAVVDRSLLGMRNLIDRTLADVRVTANMPPRTLPVSVAECIAEVEISASLEAQARGCQLTVAAVDPRLGVLVDRDLLLSALGNLLQNAFKFTRPRSIVTLRAHGTPKRVLIDIEDRCGGLPDCAMHTLFLPFRQGGADKSGLGLGLPICRRIVEAHHGTLSVRDLPGVGCVFTIDLPRHADADTILSSEAIQSDAGPS